MRTWPSARRLLGLDLEQAAQLPPARALDLGRRQCGDGCTGQRALRGRRGRNNPAAASAGLRRPHAAASADRHLLPARRKGKCALLRSQAGLRDAVDEDVVDLRPPDEPALHAEEAAAAPGTPCDFIACYNADNRLKRIATERFKPFTYDELVAREKANIQVPGWMAVFVLASGGVAGRVRVLLAG